MIVGTGVDLAEVPRVRHLVERYGRRFIERVYTPSEIAYVERKANRFERFAARFAAKEAGMKAIGTGWRHGVTWQDFDGSQPAFGKTHAAAARRGGAGCGEARRAPYLTVLNPHRRVRTGAPDPGRLTRNLPTNLLQPRRWRHVCTSVAERMMAPPVNAIAGGRSP